MRTKCRHEWKYRNEIDVAQSDQTIMASFQYRRAIAMLRYIIKKKLQVTLITAFIICLIKPDWRL